MSEVGAVQQPVLEWVGIAPAHEVEPVLPPKDVRRRKERDAARAQHARDLCDEAGSVDDVLDDLGGEDDVEGRVVVREVRDDLPVVEGIDLVDIDVDPARLGLGTVEGIELDADELGALVPAEPLEEQPARAAQVEDARAGEVICHLAHESMCLRVSVLDVEEEATVELPHWVVRNLEEVGGE